MTHQAFNLAWATLLNAFPNSSNSHAPETQRIYWEMLNKIPEESFMNGVTICLEECEFFPTIATLREAAYRKSFHTGNLTQMQIHPPMSKSKAVQALRNMIGRLPEPKNPKNSMLEFKTITTIPCIGCGAVCILPFADGNEQAVICEICNRRGL